MIIWRGAAEANGEVGGRGVEVVARSGHRLLLQPPLISAVHMPEFVCWRGCGGDGVGSTQKKQGVWCIGEAFLVQQCLWVGEEHGMT